MMIKQNNINIIYERMVKLEKGLCNAMIYYYYTSNNALDITGIEAQSGENIFQGGKPDTGKFHSSYIGMNVCGSTYENGCMAWLMACELRQHVEYYHFTNFPPLHFI